MDSLITGNSNIIAFFYAQQLLGGTRSAAMEKLRSMNKASADLYQTRLRKEIFEKARDVHPSRYNCVATGKNRTVVYNSLTNALALLSHGEYERLQGKKRLTKDLRSRFLENGLLLANINESQILDDFRANRSLSGKRININITASMRCNAHCAYCYEAGARHGDFDPQTLERTLHFIQNLRPRKELKITWFGGEPLLAPDVIDHISSGLRDRQIKFSSYLITNGSLITREMVEKKFPVWNVQDAQITLDGCEQTYIARKNYKNCADGIFQKVLDKIEWTADAGITVHIRLNMDRENADEIMRLLDVLQERFGSQKKIVYYPAFLTGVKSRFDDLEKIAFVKKMFSTVNDPSKFNIPNRLHSMPRLMACMREDPSSFTIDVSGRVYPCEHLVGKNRETLGTVRRFSWAKNKSRFNPPLRSECKECAWLPKCMGGCAENLKTDDSPCLIERHMLAAYLEILAG